VISQITSWGNTLNSISLLSILILIITELWTNSLTAHSVAIQRTMSLISALKSYILPPLLRHAEPLIQRDPSIKRSKQQKNKAGFTLYLPIKSRMPNYPKNRFWQVSGLKYSLQGKVIPVTQTNGENRFQKI